MLVPLAILLSLFLLGCPSPQHSSKVGSITLSITPEMNKGAKTLLPAINMDIANYGNLEKLAVFIFFLLRWSLMLWSLLDFQISNDFWLRFPASGTLFPCPFCPPDAVRADYAP